MEDTVHEHVAPRLNPSSFIFKALLVFKQSKLSETKNTLFIANFFLFFLSLAGIKNIEK
jgi:hypothetical protein